MAAMTATSSSKKLGCQHLVASRKCSLPILAVLDGVPLCSQHLYSRLAKKAA